MPKGSTKAPIDAKAGSYDCCGTLPDTEEVLGRTLDGSSEALHDTKIGVLDADMVDTRVLKAKSALNAEDASGGQVVTAATLPHPD